jgi:hypothetical protein
VQKSQQCQYHRKRAEINISPWQYHWKYALQNSQQYNFYLAQKLALLVPQDTRCTQFIPMYQLNHPAVSITQSLIFENILQYQYHKKLTAGKHPAILVTQETSCRKKSHNFSITCKETSHNISITESYCKKTSRNISITSALVKIHLAISVSQETRCRKTSHNISIAFIKTDFNICITGTKRISYEHISQYQYQRNHCGII